MARLRLWFLGSPRVEIDGYEVVFPRRKSLALLVYLADSREAHSRDKLATLLWPESSQTRARGALRRELSSMRKALGSGWIAADAATVNLGSVDEIWIDVRQFEEAVSSGGEGANLDSLATAAALYRDDFLTGFTLPDTPGFDEWQFFRAETLRQSFASALERLIEAFSVSRKFDDAIVHARLRLALDSLHEPAHRTLMALYARAGQQSAALRQYEVCLQLLDDELGVPPASETTALYEEIRQRRIGPEEGSEPDAAMAELRERAPSSRPAFLDDADAGNEFKAPVFVRRERELARLHEFLDEVLNGRGRVVFVTGGPGRGKTSLMSEFVLQAHSTHSDLLVVGGSCSSYAGIGDPYLPFREVMEMLAGDVEAAWEAGTITSEQARRLWRSMPETAKVLTEVGPDLIDVFVRGRALTDRIGGNAERATAWGAEFNVLVADRRTRPADLAQSFLFEQYDRVLQNLSERHPLLLTLDDLQWADTASISLLFHLGRRIENSRILVVGAYRPEELAPATEGGRHPLHKVLSEFKRAFGDNEIDLAHPTERDNREFVNDLLDTWPNRLGEDCRRDLFRRTGGHPLFTVELVRAMQERGDLVQDDEGLWAEAPSLDWDLLPARTEGVIEERLGRLESELQEILRVASVEGELFTLEAVGQVLGIDQRRLYQSLSRGLRGRHRLVREREDVATGDRLLTRYQFGHVLFQQYLYQTLGTGERRHLHGEVGRALETLYEEQSDEVAAQLFHHFREAGEQSKAVAYARLASRRALTLHAYEEAIQHLQVALDLLDADLPSETRLVVLEELGDAHRMLPRKYQSISQYRSALEEWSKLPDTDEAIAMRLHRKILDCTVRSLWLVDLEEFETLPQTVAESRAYLEAGLVLADSKTPNPDQVRTLTALANQPSLGSRLSLDIDSAERYARTAVALAEEQDAPVELADALRALNNIYFTRGRIRDRLEISRRQLALAQDPRFDDVHTRIDITTDMGDSLMLVGQYAEAIHYYEEAEKKARQIVSPGGETIVIGMQAYCWFNLDRWDQVLRLDDATRSRTTIPKAMDPCALRDHRLRCGRTRTAW